jgi:hypothetical protein
MQQLLVPYHFSRGAAALRNQQLHRGEQPGGGAQRYSAC